MEGNLFSDIKLITSEGLRTHVNLIMLMYNINHNSCLSFLYQKHPEKPFSWCPKEESVGTSLQRTQR